MNIQERIYQSQNFKKFRFIFISASPGSVTSFMKCEIPAKVLNCYDIDAALIGKDDLSLYLKNTQENDIVILSKVHPWLEEKTIELLLKIKSKVNKIFCEASEEGSFDCFLSKFKLHKENLNTLSSEIIDGFLYETEELKSLIIEKIGNTSKFFYTRHLHSNCHQFLNPFSGINHNFEIKNEEDKISALSVQKFKEFNSVNCIGYIGHPKYCHDYLALNIANYELSHKFGKTLKFVSSNPGPIHNVRDTLIVDFAFSLMEKNQHSEVYYDFKTSNKVNALWSLGIPALYSPLPSYQRVFSECGIDINSWSFPTDYKNFDCNIRNSQSFGRAIALKIFDITSNSNFQEMRRAIFNASYNYNPMNIFWLYEEMFNFIK